MHTRSLSAVLASGLAAVTVLAAPNAAWADHAPVLVVPGRPDVPVIINGVDASWAVVEGDWGLYRPGHRGVTLEGAWPLGLAPSPPGYFPTTGRRPRYGRHEVRAARGAPRPAESFYRTWSTESGARVRHEYPPYDPPPVIRTPRLKP